MKKLLTIVLVALALCLAISAAIATNEVDVDGNPNVNPQQGYLLPSEAIKNGLPDTSYVLDLDVPDNGVKHFQLTEESKAAIEKAKCGDTLLLQYVSYDTPTKPELHEITYRVDHYQGDGELTVVTKPTCTTAGKGTFVCQLCKQTIEKTLPALGHSWERGEGTIEIVTVNATCDEGGTTAEACKDCKELKPNGIVRTWDKIKHIEKKVVDVYPTCLEPTKAKVHYVCAYCGINLKPGETAEDPWVKSKTVYYEPSENINTIKKFANFMNINFDGHDWDGWLPSRAATCSTNAYNVHFCKLCGKQEEREVLYTALGSKYVLQSKSALNNCFEVEATWRCANCNGKICGDIVVNFTNGVVTNDKITRKAPDASWTRYNSMDRAKKDYQSLASYIGIVPGAYYKDFIGAHRYVKTADYLVKETKATCTEPAYKYYKCYYADKIAGHDDTMYLKDAVAPKLGHDWTEWKVKYAVGAGNNEFGVWVRTCQRAACGETENYISKLPPADLCEEHKAVLDTEKSVPATCTEAGLNVYKCEVCGTELEDLEEEAPALGHKGSLVKTIKAATCTEDGEGEFYCSVCKTGYTDKIAATGHSWDEGKITKEATKDAKGVKTFTCTVCGATKTEDVEYVVTADPKYSVSALAYNGQTVTGKVAHTPDTKEAEGLTIRVTFFLAGNYYMATIGDIEADGTFSVDGVGPIEYISVVINGTSSVNPNDVVSLGSGELEVK